MDVDDLYGLPLDRFVPERTALARTLRNDGERERAGEVAALKKPSVAAWAVNQLVRTQGRAVAELFEAGDRLRAAQDDVLAGRGDARSLRAAVERERLAVDALTDAARGLLSSEGHELSDTIIERVSDTLHAAAFDGETREQVRDGRLERELRHVGLGGLGALGGGSPAPRAEKPAPRAEKRAPRGEKRAPRAEKRPPRAEKGAAARRTGSGETKEQAAERAERERGVREQAKAQEEARRAARATEREARRRAERAGRGAKLARERRDKAADALREAEAGLEAAEAEVQAAGEAVREAEAAVREARR